MAYITKRGNSYSVRYTYEDEHELAAGTLQFQPMQRIPTKKPTVQKPCIDRVSPEFSGLHSKKERQIVRFGVQYLVHLQGLEPWAH